MIHRYPNDIIFNIGLYCKFKQSIAIIGSCKDLWHLRLEFYKRKHLIYYSRPILSFWTPEQHFYASQYQFTLLILELTLQMEMINLYQNNNTINDIKDYYDYYPTFTIDNRWLTIWHINKYQQNYQWSFTFHATRTDIKDKLQAIIENKDIMSMEYAVIDLKTTVPCWSIYKSKPTINHEYEWISLDRLGKIISGE